MPIAGNLRPAIRLISFPQTLSLDLSEYPRWQHTSQSIVSDSEFLAFFSFLCVYLSSIAVQLLEKSLWILLNIKKSV